VKTMMETYASQLKLIKNEPDYNRIRAIKRFFLLMDFENNYLPLQQHKFPKISFTKALIAYSKLRGVCEHTFFRWLVTYRKLGIKGLLPKFGSRGNWHPLDKHKLMATIAIDIRAPLKCLKSIQKIIKRCRSIKPDVKKSSLSKLDRYFNSLTFGSPLTLSEPLTDEEITLLMRYKASIHKNHSKKASVLLMANEGRTLADITETAHTAARTVYRWLSNFNRDRLASIKVHVNAPDREAAKAERQTRVVDILHKSPSIYRINRTSWTYGAISQAYEKEYGASISKGQIAKIIKNTGYSWRHARTVLTSPDLEYKAKVERLLNALHELKDGERFFFIDEVGPYRVKKYGGQRLSLKDQVEIIPAQQKGRGKVQFVAALEAVTNQMIWIFTPDKSAISMTRLLQKIVHDYDGCPAIFFTWDAISVHSSKVVTKWIANHNSASKGPRIEVVPLPSKSQFLNVIESVFCGMKKAVICNSDYATPHDMQEAIARHFEERNIFFKINPKRAGNKIWDKQGFDFDRLAGGLFKKM